MWSTRNKQLANGRVNWVAIESESSPVAYADVLRLWRQDAEFRTFFIEVLKNSPYTAFRWETPPITTANSDQPFEFVMLDSPGLVCKPDTLSFAEHFHTATPGSIIEFSNLGGDAVMVVPCPTDPMTDYSHLAAFLRNAPESAQHQLWNPLQKRCRAGWVANRFG